MKKEEPKKKSILKVIKSLFHNQQSRSILFLGAYAIFFALLIVSLRSNASKKQIDTTTSTSKNVSVQYKLDKIKQGNYYSSLQKVFLDHSILLFVKNNNFPCRDKSQIRNLLWNKQEGQSL